MAEKDLLRPCLGDTLKWPPNRHRAMPKSNGGFRPDTETIENVPRRPLRRSNKQLVTCDRLGAKMETHAGASLPRGVSSSARDSSSNAGVGIEYIDSNARKSKGITLERTRFAALLLLFVLASLPAFADTFVINFDVTQGPAATGSFSFDGTSFSKFRVFWDDGAAFDLTTVANSFGASSCFGDSSSGAAAAFEILAKTVPCTGPTYTWYGNVPGETFAPGDFFFDWTAPCNVQPIGCTPIVPGGTFTGGSLGPEDLLTPPLAGSPLVTASAQGTWNLTDTSTSVPEPSGPLPIVLVIACIAALKWKSRKHLWRTPSHRTQNGTAGAALN